MKVLITGGKGYLGTVIAKHLPYEYEIVDLKDGKDYRGITRVNADVVIHLAAIVGDAACRESPREARAINYRGLKQFLQRCKESGVERFIMASTCSVYGEDSVAYCYENGPINPLSLYATTKWAAEQLVLNSKSENFHPTILRFGTAFGYSPAMRFNLVLNHFARMIKNQKTITVYGGNQWRPFIHVSDIARAIYTILEKPPSQVSGHIFNIANENICFKFLAENLKKWFPDINIIIDKNMQDKRTYRVNTDKARLYLNFHPYVSIREGLEEMIEKIE